MDSARSNLVTGISGPEPEPHRRRIWVIESRTFTTDWRPLLSHVKFNREAAEWQVEELLAEARYAIDREYRVVPYVAA